MEQTTSTSPLIPKGAQPQGTPATSTTIGAEPEPHLIIRPSQGWQALDLRQVWQFRDLLATLAQRDVKLRYRQTALGAAWVILQPLIGAGIFAFVFGSIAQLPSGGVPYILFAYSALLCWNMFSGTLTKTSNVLIANTQLVSKVYFPRLVLPLSTVYSSLIDFGVASLLMIVLMAIYHVAPTWGLLLLPIWVLGTLTLAVGLGLYLSALMVSYRDVAYVVPVAINFLLYASPVAYSTATVIERVNGKFSPEVTTWITRAFLANPMAGLLQAFRWSLIGGEAPIWGSVVYSLIFAVAIFVLGAFAFRRMEKRFADVI